MKNLIDRVVLI